MYASVFFSLHLIIKVGVSSLFGHPLIDDSASKLINAVFESSIFDVPVDSLHFELDEGTLIVFEDTCFSAMESKHASLATELFSFVQAAISGKMSFAKPLAALINNINGNNFFMCCQQNLGDG